MASSLGPTPLLLGSEREMGCVSFTHSFLKIAIVTRTPNCGGKTSWITGFHGSCSSFMHKL